MEQLILTGNISSTDIPLRISEPFETPPTDLAQINQRLLNGGKLTFEDADLEFGEINIHTDSKLFLGVHELELKNSRIITNGNFLEIFCKKIKLDSNSKILSFQQKDTKAKSEIDGDYGGDVHIYVTGQVESPLSINLKGQDGGDGIQGVTGTTGKEGRRGRSARNGSFGTCRRGPGKGKRGGRGGTGGNGTDGGDGGDGGVLKVYFIEQNIPADLNIGFKALPGGFGKGGAPGKGGEGGRGGKGGSNAGNCIPRSDPERSRGPKGPRGISGKAGKSGVNGKEGKSFIERIEVDELK